MEDAGIPANKLALYRSTGGGWSSAAVHLVRHGGEEDAVDQVKICGGFDLQMGRRTPALAGAPLDGWIQCALAQLRLLASLRRAWRVVELDRGISVLKAVFPSCCLMRWLAGGDCVLARRSGELPWWEIRRRHDAEGNLSNKLVFLCRWSGGAGGLISSLFTRLGDEEEGKSVDLVRRCFNKGDRASLGCFLTTALSSSSSSMVEWRPPPPLTSTTVLRLASDGLNQPPGLDAAAEALQVVCGLLPSPPPKWFVPGEVEIGRAQLRVRRAGEGAGPNCISSFCFEVLSAKCLGLCVIFRFYVALSAKCTSSVESQ